jgi:hypothetical protein
MQQLLLKLAMCETLYIWLHSELKKDAYKDEMSIENRMVEMYHAHTDEDTKLRIMSKFSSEDNLKKFKKMFGLKNKIFKV